MEHFLGIDIGGTNIKAGLVSANGELLEKKKYPTKEARKEGDFMESFLDILDELFGKYPEVSKVGIGIPGTLAKDRRSTIELPNVPEFSRTPLLQPLESRFPSKLFRIENDANAAALGELYFSKEKMPDHFIFITLGTGVGGGAIIDRKIFKGGDGNGMEIGHIISGNGKTLERNIGKQGILGLALTTLEGYRGDSVLDDMNDLTSKMVVKAAHKEDDAALDVFSEVGKFLGQAVITTVRLLDVKTIIIGGGVSQTFDYVKARMYKEIHTHLTPYYIENLDIRLATLGNNAGIIGAASLCFIDNQ